MFNETLSNMLQSIWPMGLIVLTILISLRASYILIYHPETHLYNELLSLLAVIYIMCLFYIVTFQDVSWSTSNFIPFKEIFRYEIGTNSFFRNVFGNMLMFIPFGFFTAYYLKLEKAEPVLLLGLLISTVIEATQLLIGRVFDVDDIILNVCGGMIGYFIYANINWLKSKLPKSLNKPIVYDVLILIVIGLVLGYFIIEII